MPQPVVIEAVRTPFGRKGGAFREIRPDSILAGALAGLCFWDGPPRLALSDEASKLSDVGPAVRALLVTFVTVLA